MRNPSSCREMRTTAEADGASGAQSMLSARFQVDHCSNLSFRPSARVKLLGGTRQGQHPKLQAVLDVKSADAGLARARVTLPKVERLDRARLANVCGEALFTQRGCPKRSIVGNAVAWSPLIGRPLKGHVYLRSSGRGRPVLALSLDGEVFIEATAEIQVRKDHRIQLIFKNLPDIPLDGVKIVLQGGNKGLLTNHWDLCIRPVDVGLRFTSHNGSVKSQRIDSAGRCSGGARLPREHQHGTRR
jgi:hypothetical protein